MFRFGETPTAVLPEQQGKNNYLQELVNAKSFYEQIKALEAMPEDNTDENLEALNVVAKNLDKIFESCNSDLLTAEQKEYFYEFEFEQSKKYGFWPDSGEALESSDLFISQLAKKLGKFEKESLKKKAESVLLDLLSYRRKEEKRENDDIPEWLKEQRAQADEKFGEKNEAEKESINEEEYYDAEASVAGGSVYDVSANYAYMEIIRSLGKVGSIKAMDDLIDFMEERPVMFTDSIADTLSKIDPLCAASKIESLPGKDYFTKRDASAVEAMILAAILQSIKENGQRLNQESIKSLKIEKLDIVEIEGEDRCVLEEDVKKEAVRMMEVAYRRVFTDEKTHEFNWEAYTRVMDEFKDYMFTPGKMDGETVFVLKFQSKLVGLLRFRPKEKDSETMLAKSLIIDEKTQGFSLGTYFQENTMELMRRRFNIEAITRVNNHANAKYKKLGFIFDPKTFTKNGVEYYNITLPKQEQLKKAA